MGGADLLLPHMDGYAVCKALKNAAETASLPIVMLTARGEPNDRIKGLELGADDYLVKPFSLRELILRIQGLLRRSRSDSLAEVLEVGAFRVDKHKFEIQLEGRRLDLTRIEFRLLALLIERRGRTQSREALLSDVLGYENPIMTRTVDTHIRRLRGKLGIHAQRLETVRTEGYRFTAGQDLVSRESATTTPWQPPTSHGVRSTSRPWQGLCGVCQSSFSSVPQAPTSPA